MVFIGGSWGPGRRRRRRNPFYPYGNQDPYGQPPPGYGYPPPPYGYGRRGFRPVGYGGGGSCLRDMLLVEGGCCLAESLGCGPQLVLVTPAVIGRRRREDGREQASSAPGAAGTGTRINRLLMSLVAGYQREVSPKRPACCRFSPTCSHYALEALQRHGALRGTLLTARRILRCRPGAAGGFDPVPH
jgi:putative membrane protein insertion efficiency factor